SRPPPDLHCGQHQRFARAVWGGSGSQKARMRGRRPPLLAQPPTRTPYVIAAVLVSGKVPRKAAPYGTWSWMSHGFTTCSFMVLPSTSYRATMVQTSSVREIFWSVPYEYVPLSPVEPSWKISQKEPFANRHDQEWDTNDEWASFSEPPPATKARTHWASVICPVCQVPAIGSAPGPKTGPVQPAGMSRSGPWSVESLSC